ncbi:MULTISPECIES: TraR/DksA C4-type zinc finger protein [Cohnella]|mgnify:CR=1 FL=1|uniref:TraR/DksA C4-type zinc finger protein n=1 Tax=Cohnella TaxID=329857 RepID=UPI0009B9FA12|nr:MULTISPECIES: TraR/DksA C4-type zinc finger protein [Cohnella]MBN2983398.1 TraR/DksA C4-type zinc finger protein [Cohnella algarum]
MATQLTEEKLHSLRRRLLDEKSELEKRVRQNGHFGLINAYKDSTGELSGIDNHPADAGTDTFERAKDIALLERQAFRLDKIEAALERMDTGEYGRCAACGGFIPAERLEAQPTAIYCAKHEPVQREHEQRPIEEYFLQPPFGRTSLDGQGDQNGFDGEDAWQIVESWGNSDSPALAEGADISDYEMVYTEADENEGFVEPLESFLATDITGTDISVVRNRAYHRYLADREGEPLLEPDEIERE